MNEDRYTIRFNAKNEFIILDTEKNDNIVCVPSNVTDALLIYRALNFHDVVLTAKKYL